MKIIRLMTILSLALVSLACNTTFRQVEKSYLPHDQNRAMQVYPRLTGEACEQRILFFIPIGDSSVNKALGQLTKYSTQVDNILGVQVEDKWSFWLLGSTHCTVVSGYPVLYKDNGAHWQPFEKNMMMGKLLRAPVVSGQGQTPARSNATTSSPIPSLTEPVEMAAPVRTEPVAPAAVRNETPTQPMCEEKCGRIGNLWNGSDAVRSAIRKQCMGKCLKPEKKDYRDCIDSAKSWDDLRQCNKL